MPGLDSNAASDAASRQPCGAAPSSSNLRNSCHAYALSKVRCRKEKPACSRCARRGIACEYFVTKRPGRKRRSHNVNNDDTCDAVDMMMQEPVGEQDPRPGAGDHGETTPSESHNYLDSSSGLHDILPPNTVSMADTSTSPDSPDMFCSLLMSAENYLPSPLTGISDGFFDFGASPADFMEPDRVATKSHSQARNDIAKLLIPDDNDFDMFSETCTGGRPSTSGLPTPSPNGQLQRTRDAVVSSTSSSRCCLLQALDLMKQLSATTSPDCPLANGTDNATRESSQGGQSHNPTAQAVVAENKQVIEIVSNMLQCPCAEDDFLLNTLSMIAFKLLGRYADASRKRLGGEGGGGCGGGKKHEDLPSKEHELQLGRYLNRHDDQVPGRMTAQLVLGELHRVKRLVSQISPRLRERKVGGADRGRATCLNKTSAADGRKTPLSVGESTIAPFSAAALSQIEMDLSSCLGTLSSDIIDMLRKS